MKTTNISTYSQSQLKYEITDRLSVSLTLADSTVNLTPDSLFQMAARMNKKRSFLFVSKVLGKHIPTHPLVPQLAAGLLALKFYQQKTGNYDERVETIVQALQSNEPLKLQQAYEQLDKKKLALTDNHLFVGFAETATALGHAMYACFEDSAYFHTTREDLLNETSVITFEEEHSHATAHRCYVSKEVLESKQPVVLIDDEMTTGKTVLNIIRSIHASFPRKEYAVVSLLDWRNETNKQQFTKLEQELGITIETVSLLSGEVEVKGEPLLTNSFSQNGQADCDQQVNLLNVNHSLVEAPYISLNSLKEQNNSSYLRDTGRFGLETERNQALEQECREIALQLSNHSAQGKTLVLGTGEFMYIPMKIASYMEGEVYYQSTTRSPIHPINDKDYAIQNGITFPSPDDERVQNYLYNLSKYEDVYVVLERATMLEKLKVFLQEMDRFKGKVHIVCLAGRGDEDFDKQTGC
ncbi:phosphoribosyltransferase family protein [Bacillus tianshenii]|nr:phosphoribosyltransferase family protein [Bacillus tianshenii]